MWLDDDAIRQWFEDLNERSGNTDDDDVPELVQNELTRAIREGT